MAKAFSAPVVHPHMVHNRRPTPQDLLELSSRIYKGSRKLYNEADSQGMRVYHDELITGDVRLVMLVPSWFPKAHVAFDWTRLQGEQVSVIFVLRGTMQDLVGNTKANLQLIYNKLVDDQHLPDTATDATKVIQCWLMELILRHPQLATNSSSSSSGNISNISSCNPQQHQQQLEGLNPLRLDIHVTGHSLGGLLAEVATVESVGFAAARGAEWSCTSFESPGLPDVYYTSALRIAPKEHWEDVIMSYLAAPNVINMLYRHLGRIVHVMVPWGQTWTYVAKSIGADVARVTAWAIVGGMVMAGSKQLSILARRHVEDEVAAVAAAGSMASLQQCDASLPSLLTLPQAAATAATAANGPAVPQFLIVAATPSSSADAAARRLLSGPFPPAAAAAAADIAGRASTAVTAASQQRAITEAVVGAAAAAGNAAASLGGARILHGVLRRSGLSALATAFGGWMFGRGGIWGVMECLSGVLGVEVEELIYMHALGPMRQCFDPHTGELKSKFSRKMASWPHLGSRGKVVLTAAKQVAKWTLPSFVCRDNIGLANVMSRTAMVEARCARLQGYVVLEDAARDPGELDAAAVAVSDAAPEVDVMMPLLEADDLGSAEAAAGQQQQHQQLGLSLALLAGSSLAPRVGSTGQGYLTDAQQEEQSLMQLNRQQQQHRRHAALPAPRGLGLGLSQTPRRHSSSHSRYRGQQQQLNREDDLMIMSPPRPRIHHHNNNNQQQQQHLGGAEWLAAAAAGAVGIAGVEGGLEGLIAEAARASTEVWATEAAAPGALAEDEAEAMAVDGPEAGMFADAVELSPADGFDDDVTAVAGAAAPPGGFIHLGVLGRRGLGGAFEPVRMAGVAAAAAGQAAIEDEELRDAGVCGLMQLHLAGC